MQNDMEDEETAMLKDRKAVEKMLAKTNSNLLKKHLRECLYCHILSIKKRKLETHAPEQA
jgi:DNA-binding FrmR family transcriptional regulator